MLDIGELAGNDVHLPSVLVELAYMIISTSISPPDDTVLGHGRAPILRGREHGLPRPLPLSLIESKLLLDVCYRSAENMLAEMNTVRLCDQLVQIFYNFLTIF